jgi:hypothetical protein
MDLEEAGRNGKIWPVNTTKTSQQTGLLWQSNDKETNYYCHMAM